MKAISIIVPRKEFYRHRHIIAPGGANMTEEQFEKWWDENFPKDPLQDLADLVKEVSI